MKCFLCGLVLGFRKATVYKIIGEMRFCSKTCLIKSGHSTEPLPMVRKRLVTYPRPKGQPAKQKRRDDEGVHGAI